MKMPWLVYLLLLVLLSGCGTASNAATQPTPVAVHDKLRIVAAYVRPATKIGPAPTMPPMDHGQGTMLMPTASANNSVGGAYFTITNVGGAADTLLGATTDAAEQVELHETVNDNNIARMVAHPEGVAVPANGELRFEPGNYHMMLVGLRQSLTVGMQVQLTLRFAKNGDVQFSVPVQTGP